MKKILSSALLAAATLGVAGIAQAQTVIVAPQPVIVGSQPAVTTTYYGFSGEIQPANGSMEREHTYNVPQQAGEASTMTNGVPNAATNNHPTPSMVVIGTAVTPAVVSSTVVR